MMTGKNRVRQVCGQVGNLRTGRSAYSIKYLVSIKRVMLLAWRHVYGQWTSGMVCLLLFLGSLPKRKLNCPS